MKHLLIVDDEIGSRESLRAVFSRTHKVSVARNADEAQQMLSQARVDLVLLDVMMPGKDGLSFLKDIQSMYPEVPVIMVSASTSVQPVVQAIKVGACDFVTKPFDVEQIRMTVTRALQSSALQRNVEVLKTEVGTEYPTERIVGQSASFQQALEHARKAAETDSTVLIYGETGTGKELIARSIHAWSARREEPFVPVHCAALPEALMESELFGHEKGAFTGADRQKPGRFDLAGMGTIFFDEVSEMSLTTQVKLLRVLQEKEFMRVGGTRVIRTEVRVIAATGRDLKAEIAEKRFRDDLFYRLSVVPIRLPPLRERPGDIAPLANHFFEFFKRRIGARAQCISEDTMQCLCSYPWPGNIREVRNIIERMLVLHGREEQLLPAHLPEEFHAGTRATPAVTLAPDVTLRSAVQEYERALIIQAMREANGVQTAAARRLGTTRRILKYRMRQMNLQESDFLK